VWQTSEVEVRGAGRLIPQCIWLVYCFYQPMLSAFNITFR